MHGPAAKQIVVATVHEDIAHMLDADWLPEVTLAIPVEQVARSTGEVVFADCCNDHLIPIFRSLRRRGHERFVGKLPHLDELRVKPFSASVDA